jgi:hypothetical protein
MEEMGTHYKYFTKHTCVPFHILFSGITDKNYFTNTLQDYNSLQNFIPLLWHIIPEL